MLFVSSRFERPNVVVDVLLISIFGAGSVSVGSALLSDSNEPCFNTLMPCGDVMGRGSGSTFTGSKWLIGSNIAVWSIYVKPCHRKCRLHTKDHEQEPQPFTIVFCVPYSNHEKQKYWLWGPKKRAGMYSYSCYTIFLNPKVMAQ